MQEDALHAGSGRSQAEAGTVSVRLRGGEGSARSRSTRLSRRMVEKVKSKVWSS